MPVFALLSSLRTLSRRLQTPLPALCLILVANLPGLQQVVANAPLRADTDTAAMLNAMRDTEGIAGWWKWFTGDWFLHNGFYRPTTCLSLLIDYTLYGETGWGYRLTNWLLAVLTAVGVYALLRWFARQWLSNLLTEEWQAGVVALAGAVAFSLQQTDALHTLRSVSGWWLIALWMLIAGSFSHVWQGDTWKPFLREHGWRLWLAAGAFFWGWDRLVHGDFERLIVWVPARTALLSTCLSVWGVWSLLRWGDTGRGRFLLAACLLYAGSLGAYEQPVTVVGGCACGHNARELEMAFLDSLRCCGGDSGWVPCPSLRASACLAEWLSTTAAALRSRSGDTPLAANASARAGPLALLGDSGTRPLSVLLQKRLGHTHRRPCLFRSGGGILELARVVRLVVAVAGNDLPAHELAAPL